MLTKFEKLHAARKARGASPKQQRNSALGAYSLPGVGDFAALPAKISLLYRSRDDQLSLFEDEQGHLTSVPTSRLA